MKMYYIIHVADVRHVFTSADIINIYYQKGVSMRGVLIVLLAMGVSYGQINLMKVPESSRAAGGDSLYIAMTTIMPISLTGIQRIDGRFKASGQVSIGYNVVAMAMRLHAGALQPIVGAGLGIETGYNSQAIAAAGALVVVSNFTGFIGYDFNSSGIKFGIGYTVILGFPSALSWIFYRRAL